MATERDTWIIWIIWLIVISSLFPLVCKHLSSCPTLLKKKKSPFSWVSLFTAHLSPCWSRHRSFPPVPIKPGFQASAPAWMSSLKVHQWLSGVFLFSSPSGSSQDLSYGWLPSWKHPPFISMPWMLNVLSPNSWTHSPSLLNRTTSLECTHGLYSF